MNRNRRDEKLGGFYDFSTLRDRYESLHHAARTVNQILSNRFEKARRSYSMNWSQRNERVRSAEESYAKGSSRAERAPYFLPRSKNNGRLDLLTKDLRIALE